MNATASEGAKSDRPGAWYVYDFFARRCVRSAALPGPKSAPRVPANAGFGRIAISSVQSDNAALAARVIGDGNNAVSDHGSASNSTLTGSGPREAPQHQVCSSVTAHAWSTELTATSMTGSGSGILTPGSPAALSE